ncbi:MAG TPA: glycosyltransferase family 39 protein, partial [Candidatus Saccharibacteria bacterium]|nr:glycosyltransferase family 39 protein [Candidatus Saccharibacteria bacterium]
MKKFIVPISALVALSLVSLFFIGLNFTSNVNYIPDPEPISNSNYNVLSVKVLNVSHTNANDNYVPFRQAQFIINRLDPATSSFIDEWGVHFFQRTPLMGAVSAFYFDLFMSKPPIDYLWRTSATDPSNTYLQFQIIATILNSLLLIPAYYLIKKLFNSKTAYISLLFLASSHFFLYNSFYTWPKSLVAFFILFSWYLLLENKLRFTILAGIVSAAAYLTHDLAFLYIVASLFMLLYKKRFRDIVIVLGITVFSALPWLITSSVIFKKASTFYLYPISVENIPQPGREKEIMSKFFKTSIWELFMIRIRTLTYLLTPYSILDIKPLALSN